MLITVGLHCGILKSSGVLKVAAEKSNKIKCITSYLLFNIVVPNALEYLRFLLSKTTLNVCDRERERKRENVCH